MSGSWASPVGLFLQGMMRAQMEKIFPTILIVLDVLSAVPYAVKSDMKMTVYWLAAGLLTYSVTWM